MWNKFDQKTTTRVCMCYLLVWSSVLHVIIAAVFFLSKWNWIIKNNFHFTLPFSSHRFLPIDNNVTFCGKIIVFNRFTEDAWWHFIQVLLANYLNHSLNRFLDKFCVLWLNLCYTLCITCCINLISVLLVERFRWFYYNRYVRFIW